MCASKTNSQSILPAYRADELAGNCVVTDASKSHIATIVLRVSIYHRPELSKSVRIVGQIETGPLAITTGCTAAFRRLEFPWHARSLERIITTPVSQLQRNKTVCRIMI